MNAGKERRRQRPMTGEEICAALALGRCSFTPATFDKRFARDMHRRASDPTRATASEAQIETLKKKLHRYRRQVRAVDLPESWRHLLSNPPKETR